jgi:hypothetical protein
MTDYEKSQNDLDEIERLLRRPQPSRKVETKIPLKDPTKYAKLWFTNQEDQDAYDSLMRKKIYYQNNYGDLGDKEFIFNGYKTTFGMFTKEFKERRFEVSELLAKQNTFISELFNRKSLFERVLKRYHSYTDYDADRQFRMNYYKVTLLILCLRELPLRHFYARAFVVALGVGIIWWKTWRYGDKQNRPLYNNHWRVMNDFRNYPLMYHLVTSRVINKAINPSALEADVWWYFQNPVFYHHHFKHYRYIYRNRRVVPWDGTFNQPIYPYLHLNDRTNFVHNGLNEVNEPKPSGNF